MFDFLISSQPLRCSDTKLTNACVNMFMISAASISLWPWPANNNVFPSLRKQTPTIKIIDETATKTETLNEIKS